MKDEAFELTLKNIKEHKTFNVLAKKGRAPKVFCDIPAPDRVFIGGSTGSIYEIISACLEKNSKAIFVVTAVTLETISQAVETFKALNMDFETTLISASTSQKLGNYNLMVGQNPVYIMRGSKND